jgi:hypothetical protein
MTEIYTTGRWMPNEGAEQAFVAAWSEFAAWASDMPRGGDALPDERPAAAGSLRQLRRLGRRRFRAGMEELAGVPRADGSGAPAR